MLEVKIFTYLLPRGTKISDLKLELFLALLEA
jgi:hypothetical protein